MTQPKKSRQVMCFLAGLRVMENDNMIATCKNHKPLTAAFLFIVIDVLNNHFVTRAERENTAREIFSYLESHLTNSELEIFDYASAKMGEVFTGKLQPRGDWNHHIDNDDWLYNLYVFYVDCLIYPSYLFQYESAPVVILPILKSLDYYTHFEPLFESVSRFCKTVMDSYKQ